MTARSEMFIDQLLKARESGELDGDPAVVTKGLQLLGLSTTEAGWVLRHVFGLEMPDAVHLAIVNKPDMV